MVKYDPPYSAKEVIEKYGYEVYLRLMKDPVHRFRMETGIELIHKEPTKKELIRIMKNWLLMTDEMKDTSDKKSYELFKLSNVDHYKKIIKEY